MTDREPRFWTYDECTETLGCTSVDEALQEYRDEVECYGDGKLSNEITLYGFAPMKVVIPGNIDTFLDSIYEDLDENYGDPDGSDAKAYPPEVMAAWEALQDAIVAAYEPWMCEVVTQVRVKVDTGEVLVGPIPEPEEK